jgi:hypothetical protein
MFLKGTAQVDSLVREQDSINQVVMLDYQKKHITSLSCEA